MNHTTYPNFKQSLLLLFFIFLSFGIFLFLTLTLPQLFGVQLSKLYYSAVNTITPVLWFPIIIYVKKKSGIPLRLSLKLPDIRIMILLVILAISAKIITNPLYGLMEFLNTLIDGRLKLDDFDAMEFDLNMVIKFIGLVLLVPVFEEIFWRKQIFGLLLNKFSPVVAIVLSSLLFAIVHFKFTSLIALFIWGILFGLVYYQTNSLGASIFLHSFCNFMDFFTKHKFVNITEVLILKFVLLLVVSVITIILIVKYLERYGLSKRILGTEAPDAK